MAGDYNLGTARGKLEIDAQGAEAGAKKGEKAVDGFTGKLTKAGPGLLKVGGVIGGVGVAIGAAFVGAVAKAADFEKGLSAIQAVSGATAPEMEKIRQKALQLGADTSFSAGEAASAMEELIKAGLPVEDVLNGAADATVALAAAGEIALPEAATIASNAMNQFSLTAKEMPKIADLIAGAANASAIDVSDFGHSLSQVGAVANLAGLSFEDTAVAIAEMGNAGIKGSDAGTSLKTMLSNLQPTTDKATGTMEELGIITKEAGNRFYDAQGRLKPLAQIQQILQDSTKNLTAAQKQQALQTIFGSDAIRAAAVLTKNGAKGYNELAANMKKVTAEQVAMARQNNLNGDLEKLKGSLDTVAIQIGAVFLPVLRSLTQNLNKLVNWFSNLSDGTRKTILVIVGIIAVLAIVVGGFLALAGAIGVVLGALAPLAAVIGITVGALLGWIAVIALIVVAVVVLAVLIIKNWDKIKAFTIKIWNIIVKFLKGVWQSVADFFKSVGGSIASFFVGLWNSIVNTTKSIWNGVVGFFAGILNGIKAAFSATWNAIKAALTAVFNVIVTIITTYVNVWKTIIMAVLTTLKGWWDAFWGVFGGIITAVFNLINAAIDLAMKAILFVIVTAAKAVYSAAVKWFTDTKNFIVSVFNAIASFASKAWTNIKNSVVAQFTAIKNSVTSIFNAVKTFLGNVWNAIYTAVAPKVTSVKNFIINGITAAKNSIVSIFNAVATFLTNAWNSIYTRVSGPVTAIKNFIASQFTTAKNKAVEIFNALATAVGKAIDTAYTKVSTVVGKIRDVFAGAGSWLINAGKNIIQGLIDGITSKINQVTDKLKELTDKIPKVKGPEKRDKTLLKPAGEWIMEGFNDSLAAGIQETYKMLGGVTGRLPTFVPVFADAVADAGGRSSLAPTPAATQSSGATIVVNSYNPVGKSDVETLSDEVTRLATLGVL